MSTDTPPPKPTIDIPNQVRGMLLKCRGTVVIPCEPNVVRLLAKVRIMQLFPTKRAVMLEDIKPGNTDIPSDVVVFIQGAIPESLRRRLPEGSMCLMYRSAVKYWEILNPQQ